MMDKTLEACPFCGAPAEMVRNGSGDYFARCTNGQCAAKTRLYHENENGARIAWNRRVERTCRYVGDEFSGGCSECRGWLDPACSYCPSCGARVMREGE